MGNSPRFKRNQRNADRIFSPASDKDLVAKCTEHSLADVKDQRIIIHQEDGFLYCAIAATGQALKILPGTIHTPVLDRLSDMVDLNIGAGI
ncbi:MAG: hypothetical protein HGJ94_07870, partial [Desulfosarcina sp.]|nr:hypothetical protein [Desulfosarcina sp.]